MKCHYARAVIWMHSRTRASLRCGSATEFTLWMSADGRGNQAIGSTITLRKVKLIRLSVTV
jgi:hypothetical protein